MELLRNSPIFESVPAGVLEEFYNHFERIRVERDETVCRQGEPGERLYFIRTGQVRVWLQDPDGREETLGFLGPGDPFGEMSVLTGAPISANVTSTTRTEIDALEGETFHELCNRHPLIYKEISKTLSIRLREANQRRFNTIQGKVTRVTTAEGELTPERLGVVLCDLGFGFRRETHRRPLLIVSLAAGSSMEVEDLQAAGLLPQNVTVIPTCLDRTNLKRDTAIVQVTSLLSGRRPTWLRMEGQWDLLLYLREDPNRVNRNGQSLEEAIHLLRPVYAHLVVAQTDDSIEAVAEAKSPDDTLAVLIDLTGEDWLRKAGPDEFARNVPEGERYAPEPGVEYYVLQEGSLDRLKRVSERAPLDNPDDEPFRFMLLTERDKPPLDFSRVRKALHPHLVHLFPLNGEPQPGSAELFPDRTLALAYGRRPWLGQGRAIRDLARARVGLALGGGGARGIAHIGVIRALEEEGIPIDLIAGSSMGAVVAAAYAEGRPARRLYHDMRHHWGKMGHFLFDVLDYNFPRTNLLRGRKIRRMIETAMKEKTIQECQVPLAIVCTDLITGREVVLEEGVLGDATFASGALPGIFRPIRWGEFLLVDGAVLNKVPARVLQRKGARVILAVNVTPDREIGMDLANGQEVSALGRVLKRFPPFNRWGNTPNILRIISRSLSVSGLNQSRIHSDIIDVEIKPRIEHFDFMRFDQFDQLVEAGAEAAREAVPAIKRILEEAQ
jgi:NTE family protein